MAMSDERLASLRARCDEVESWSQRAAIAEVLDELDRLRGEKAQPSRADEAIDRRFYWLEKEAYRHREVAATHQTILDRLLRLEERLDWEEKDVAIHCQQRRVIAAWEAFVDRAFKGERDDDSTG